MLKTAEELKDFIVWAKSQQLKSIKIQDLEIEFSETLLVYEKSSAEAIPASISSALSITPEDEEDESLLYHSSN